MQLTELRQQPGFIDADISLEKISIRIFFEQTRQHGDVMLCRNILQAADAGPVGNKLRQVRQLRPVEVTGEGVPRYGAFMKCNGVRTVGSSFAGQLIDNIQVVFLSPLRFSN